MLSPPTTILRPRHRRLVPAPVPQRAPDQCRRGLCASQQQALRQGITGVPCCVLGVKQALMEAQPAKVLTEAIDTVATEIPAGG